MPTTPWWYAPLLLSRSCLTGTSTPHPGTRLNSSASASGFTWSKVANTEVQIDRNLMPITYPNSQFQGT
jgi:hypothetical protein